MIKKVKKILISVVATIMLLPMKITNASVNPLYGPPELVKEVEDTSTTIYDILKVAIIPIILIIGFVIYFIKRKKKTKEKVIATVKKNKTDEKVVTIIAIILLIVAVALIVHSYLIN